MYRYQDYSKDGLLDCVLVDQATGQRQRQRQRMADGMNTHNEALIITPNIALANESTRLVCT